jgi:hypothetical protein
MQSAKLSLCYVIKRRVEAMHLSGKPDYQPLEFDTGPVATFTTGPAATFTKVATFTTGPAATFTKVATFTTGPVATFTKGATFIRDHNLYMLKPVDLRSLSNYTKYIHKHLQKLFDAAKIYEKTYKPSRYMLYDRDDKLCGQFAKFNVLIIQLLRLANLIQPTREIVNEWLEPLVKERTHNGLYQWLFPNRYRELHTDPFALMYG